MPALAVIRGPEHSLPKCSGIHRSVLRRRKRQDERIAHAFSGFHPGRTPVAAPEQTESEGSRIEHFRSYEREGLNAGGLLIKRAWLTECRMEREEQKQR